jgi:hypothetical protein
MRVVAVAVKCPVDELLVDEARLTVTERLEAL